MLAAIVMLSTTFTRLAALAGHAIGLAGGALGAALATPAGWISVAALAFVLPRWLRAARSWGA